LAATAAAGARMEVERGDGDEKNAAAEMKCCGGWTGGRRWQWFWRASESQNGGKNKLCHVDSHLNQ